MNYYIFRIIILMAVVLINILLIRHLSNRNTNTNTKRKKNIKHIIISVICLIVCTIIIYYPYESNFIRFNTAENSINYSFPYNIGASNYYIDNDNTVFVVSKKGNNNSYHSIVKYDNGYGMCDFKSNTSLDWSATHINENDINGMFKANVVYNEITNKTCYYIDFMKTTIEPLNTSFLIYNSSGQKINELKDLQTEQTRTFYEIQNGKPVDSYSIIINNKTYQLL